MPNWRGAFPGKYLQASDVDAPIVATIARVGVENIGDDGDRKLVVRFKEPDVKALILNKTRAEAIETIAGSADYTEWPGTRIQIERGSVRYQGKRVACLDVVEPSTPPTPAAADDDEVGF